MHNFLVRPSFPRALGLLFYFEQVSSLLASSGDLGLALRGSQRGLILRMLLTFASVVETEDRVAMKPVARLVRLLDAAGISFMIAGT